MVTVIPALGGERQGIKKTQGNLWLPRESESSLGYRKGLLARKTSLSLFLLLFGDAISVTSGVSSQGQDRLKSSLVVYGGAYSKSKSSQNNIQNVAFFFSSLNVKTDLQTLLCAYVFSS